MSEKKVQPVQIILFVFAVLYYLVAVALLFSDDPPIILICSIFLFATFIVVLGAVRPETIIRMTLGKEGFELDRHVSPPEETQKILAISQKVTPEADHEHPVPIAIEEEELIKAAQRRSETQRSAEDYLLLSTEAWEKADVESALRFGT